ncbi:anti-sigma factor domain-containing protein [Bacillus sp. BRMEA1]|uniref:anti-sigma factor domain-containing protein n=1 Tax=Neobacillus endophyticus TaxID=2738405 RepID=UPI00156415E9|nr:anti-sigma factor domain-containing protein [Neobacillus endophyticus]NRD78657.1 anti-sigma factor domain-containing protein [Neobacillus endophyticus]
MKKGIIMQIDDAFLTLLTPEGEFLRARKQEQPYVIGEEIYFFPVENQRSSRLFQSVRSYLTRPALITAIAMLVFGASIIPMYQNNKAYAYMSIGVNPSIELGINKKMQVINLTAYNNEGKKIISQLKNWKDQDVSNLAESILTKMKNDGYLKNNHQIIISTVRTDQNDSQADQKLQDNIKQIKTSVNAQNLQLTLYKGTEKDLQEAHKMGITTGQYQSTNHQNAEVKEEKQVENPSVNDTPSQKANTVPPGQIKKQMENSPTNKQQSDRVKNMIEHPALPSPNMHAPGQLKKNDIINQIDPFDEESSDHKQTKKPLKQPEKFMENDDKENQKELKHIDHQNNHKSK